MQNKVYGVFKTVEFENPYLLQLFYYEDDANEYIEELKKLYIWRANTYYIKELDIE